MVGLAFIGLALAAYFRHHPVPGGLPGDRILPLFMAQAFPAGAVGLVIADPSAAVYAADHGLQVSSGVAVLPVRVEISMPLPVGVDPRQRMAPQVATVCASRGSDSYVPRGARSGDKRNNFPGFAVAK